MKPSGFGADVTCRSSWEDSRVATRLSVPVSGDPSQSPIPKADQSTNPACHQGVGVLPWTTTVFHKWYTIEFVSRVTGDCVLFWASSQENRRKTLETCNGGDIAVSQVVC